MSLVLVIVPKEDEVDAATKVFGLSGEPLGDDPIEIDDDRRLRVWHTVVDSTNIVVAALDSQTNTMSGVITMYLIDRYSPDFAILQGTCLGDASKVPIGSVILVNKVRDISEKRLEGGQYKDRINGPHGHYISNFARQALREPEVFFNKVFELDGQPPKYELMPVKDRPSIVFENIVSSNEYRRMDKGTTDEIWSTYSDCRGYEMEAAGFVWACKTRRTPWLVVRGVSDHGTVDSVSELNRSFSSVSAALAVRTILEKVGAQVITYINKDSRTAFAQGVALDGEWSGYMGYFDSNQEEVVFREVGTMRREGRQYLGEFKSTLITGSSRHNKLAYRTKFEVEYHNTVGGTWLDNDNSREYFGVILGNTESVQQGKILRGQWLGTYSKGVRGGFFIWYNRAEKGQIDELDAFAKEQLLHTLKERRSGEDEH